MKFQASGNVDLIHIQTRPISQSISDDGKARRNVRRRYNFRIRERTYAHEQASRPIKGDYCDIDTKAECCPLTCSVSKQALYGDPWTIDKKTGEAKKRGALAQQDADLVNLKQERPWYAQIQHHVLQQMLRLFNDGFQRFFQGKAGYPKPKRRGRFRSFSYPPGDVRFQGNRVRLPGEEKIGKKRTAV